MLCNQEEAGIKSSHVTDSPDPVSHPPLHAMRSAVQAGKKSLYNMDEEMRDEMDAHLCVKKD